MGENSYLVFLNLKMPFISKLFLYLFIICVIVLALFGLYMLPSEHSSDEMKAAYFVLTTSEFEKAVFTYALIGAPIFFALYSFSRIKRRAILTLMEDKVEIDNYKIITSFSISEITSIACNDALRSDGFPKGKMTIDFKDKAGNFTSITLIDYSQSDKLMESLLNYKNIKFFASNFSFNPEVLDN
ncbi:MAG TPA: hypothetical protein VNT20_01855 [Flavisolibacter sp.]|jgi:hypothetical protein|nr:hypothetical protein [Flavisolibacter sp.]